MPGGRRVLHVITGLGTGGAERMLFNLLSRSDRGRFEPAVISLMDEGELGDRIEALGVPVHTLRLTQGTVTPGAMTRLVRLARSLRPELVMGWMYHGNLAASVAACAAPHGARLVWAVHNSLYSLSNEKRSTAVLIRASAPLSRLADAIVYVSQKSRQQHEALGFSGQAAYFIPNGFDCERFRPDGEARAAVRSSLRIDADSVVVGFIARYHPIKDHATFVQAAGELARRHPGTQFVLAGTGVDADNAELVGAIGRTGSPGNFHLLGERRDVPAVLAACDVLCLSSRSEAFPNVLGEAMACAVPCVTTDVGDAAWMVADTGFVVPPGHAGELAAALGRAIELGRDGRAALGAAARARVERELSLDSVAARYDGLFAALLEM